MPPPPPRLRRGRYMEGLQSQHRSDSSMSCGWTASDDRSRDIVAVAYGAFDTKIGNTIDFSAPMSASELQQVIQPGLADLCFPDGGHDSFVDLVPLVLPQRPGVPVGLLDSYAHTAKPSSPLTSASSLSSTAHRSASNLPNGVDEPPLFAVACYHLYKDPSVHRGATQRAVIIITRVPMFYALKSVLRSVVVPFLNAVNVLNKVAHERFVEVLYATLRTTFGGVVGEVPSSPVTSSHNSGLDSPTGAVTGGGEFQDSETSLCAQRQLDFTFTDGCSGPSGEDGRRTPSPIISRSLQLVLPRPMSSTIQQLSFGAGLRALLAAFADNTAVIHFCMLCRVPLLFVGNTAEQVGDAVCAAVHLIAPFVGISAASYLPYASLEVMDQVARSHEVKYYVEVSATTTAVEACSEGGSVAESAPTVKRDALLESLVAVGATNVHVRHREVRGVLKCDLSDGSVSMCDSLDKNVLGSSAGKRGLRHNRKFFKSLMADDLPNPHLRECYFRSTLLRYNLGIQEEFAAKDGPMYSALSHRLNIVDVPVSPALNNGSHPSAYSKLQVRDRANDEDGDSFLLVGEDDDEEDDDDDDDEYVVDNAKSPIVKTISISTAQSDNASDSSSPMSILGAASVVPERFEAELFTGGRARSVTYSLRQPPAAVLALREQYASGGSSGPGGKTNGALTTVPPPTTTTKMVSSPLSAKGSPSTPPPKQTSNPKGEVQKSPSSIRKVAMDIPEQKFVLRPVAPLPAGERLASFLLSEVAIAAESYKLLSHKNVTLLNQVDDWFHRLLGHLKASSAAEGAEDLQLLVDELLGFSASRDASLANAADESLLCCSSQPVRACEYQQRLDRTVRLRIGLDFKERAFFFIDALTRTNPRALTRKINFYVADAFAAEIVGIDAYNLSQQVVLYHSSCSLVIYVDEIKVKTSGTVYLTRNFLLFESGRLSLRKRMEIIPHDLIRGVTRYEGGVFGSSSVKLMVDIKPFKNNNNNSAAAVATSGAAMRAASGFSDYVVFDDEEVGDAPTEAAFDAAGTSQACLHSNVVVGENAANIVANKRNLDNTTAMLSFGGLDDHEMFFDLVGALQQKQARTVKLLQGIPTLHQVPGEGHALFLGSGTKLSPSGIPQPSGGAMRLLCPLWIPQGLHCVAGLEFTDEAWENQRSYPLVGWSSKLLPGDPSRISDFSGLRPLSIDPSSPCPPGFEWSTPSWVLAVSLPDSDLTTDKLLATNRGSHKSLPKTDSEQDWGYLYGYGATWTNPGGFRTHSYTGSIIRRRLWVRRRKLKVSPAFAQQFDTTRRTSVVSEASASSQPTSPSSTVNTGIIPSAAELGISTALAACVDHKLHLSFVGAGEGSAHTSPLLGPGDSNLGTTTKAAHFTSIRHLREASFSTESTDMMEDFQEDGGVEGAVRAPRDVREEDAL